MMIYGYFTDWKVQQCLFRAFTKTFLIRLDRLAGPTDIFVVLDLCQAEFSVHYRMWTRALEHFVILPIEVHTHTPAHFAFGLPS